MPTYTDDYDTSPKGGLMYQRRMIARYIRHAKRSLTVRFLAEEWGIAVGLSIAWLIPIRGSTYRQMAHYANTRR